MLDQPETRQYIKRVSNEVAQASNLPLQQRKHDALVRSSLIKLAVLIENSQLNVDVLFGFISELKPHSLKPSITVKAKIKFVIKFMRENPSLLLKCF
jgi:hypothetical protein